MPQNAPKPFTKTSLLSKGERKELSQLLDRAVIQTSDGVQVTSGAGVRWSSESGLENLTSKLAQVLDEKLAIAVEKEAGYVDPSSAFPGKLEPIEGFGAPGSTYASQGLTVAQELDALAPALADQPSEKLSALAPELPRQLAAGLLDSDQGLSAQEARGFLLESMAQTSVSSAYHQLQYDAMVFEAESSGPAQAQVFLQKVQALKSVYEPDTTDALAQKGVPQAQALHALLDQAPDAGPLLKLNEVLGSAAPSSMDEQEARSVAGELRQSAAELQEIPFAAGARNSTLALARALESGVPPPQSSEFQGLWDAANEQAQAALLDVAKETYTSVAVKNAQLHEELSALRNGETEPRWSMANERGRDEVDGSNMAALLSATRGIQEDLSPSAMSVMASSFSELTARYGAEAPTEAAKAEGPPEATHEEPELGD